MGASTVAAQNIVYLQIARQINERFTRSGCPLVFLKGMALLETAYPDLSERFLSDIDILVPRKKLGEADALFQEIGFDAPENTLEYIKEGAIPIRVDLHAGLWFFDEEKLWSRVRPKSTGSAGSLTVLSPEDQLLHIALHTILQDGMISDTAREDARRLLRYYEKDWSWELFWSQAREEGWSRAADLFLSELEGKETQPELRSILLNNKGLSYGRMWAAQERWGKKIQILWDVIFPPADFLALRYPRIPAWLRPLARLGMLVWKMCYTKIR